MMGYVAAFSCSVGLGLAVAVARFAYEGGTNGVTVAALRATLLVLLTGAYCLATGRSLRLSWRLWFLCFLLGLPMAVMFYGNIAAVQFIPIGLAALLFFTFPPLIALGEAALARRWPGGVQVASVLIAFVGLALMLGVSFETAHPLGVALSLSASIATTVNVIGSARVLPKGDRWVMFWHMAVVAALCLIAVAVARDAVVLPTAPVGWAGMIGVALLQASSIPLFYVAIHHIGPAKSAMLTNLQPVVSIVAAFLLFGELLTPLQSAGAALVLGGIVLMQASEVRRRR
ncbi:MAG: DMT family transporter [Alphaproteobacteria bacterium]|nr:DMT family transporter [Alphaproteobacteria bacterium]MCB9928342.1 DMT family transporter [Alphaproteobacteria bacterium]